MKTFQLSGAIALITASVTVAANSDHPPIEETFVTASRTETSARKIGSSVDILDAEEIEERGYISVQDILRTLPSIAVSNSGGLGKQSALRIRGEESFRTLVLVDGIDYSDPTTTQVQTQIQHLLISDIERIEVLRGPQGMMYGADAGGVINIITKKGEGAPNGNLQYEAGRYGTEKIMAAVRGKLSTIDYALSGSAVDTDGFSSHTSDSVNPDDDGYENDTVNISLGWQISDQWRAEAIGGRIDSESEFDSSFGGTNDRTGHFNQDIHKISMIWNDGHNIQRLNYQKTDVQRENITAGVQSYLATGGIEETQYFGSSVLSRTLNLIYGVDYEEQFIDTTSPTQSRDQTGSYAELQGTFDSRYFFTVGTRFDDNEDFGEHWSHRVTAAYLTTVNDGEVKFRGSYGTGFRAPSLFELDYNSQNGLAPVDEESSEGYDLGIDYRGSNGSQIKLSYFDQTIEDAIDFDFTIGTLITIPGCCSFLSGGYAQSPGESESKGWEISADIPLEERTSLLANYTYNRTEDASGEQRARRPKRITNLGFRHTVPQVDVTIVANMRFVRDTVDNGGVELDDYQVLDINVSWQALENLEVYVRSENALGREYQEVSGYNTSGAAAYAGIRFGF